MATLENIQAKIARLQAEAEAIVKKQSLTAIAKISELMEMHGLTLADLESHLGNRKLGRQRAELHATGKLTGTAKYVDPKRGDLDRSRSCASLDCERQEPKQVSD